MLDIQIQPGQYVWSQLLLRILELKMAATAIIPLGTLELWAFIILWLEPKHHKQKHALVLAREEPALADCMLTVKYYRYMQYSLSGVKSEHINRWDVRTVHLVP